MLDVTIKVDADERFKKALERAKEAVGDLTIPLTLIAKDFFKSEQAIFKLKGPGQYADLSPNYKPTKNKIAGFIYPILKFSGKLEKSVTDPTDENAIVQIVNRDTLLLGTRVRSKKGAPYPLYLQKGTSRMPARPFIFIGPESSFATSEMQGRPGRWLNTLNNYVLRKLGADIGPTSGT